MIQGTMSNAGKSLIAAALCRIFAQDGYRVAPFKSQNMALNSFITREGLEMGRAQVMQAEAAGIEPSVLMNPILLKPAGDSMSQVIVNGEVRGNYSARDYFAMKKSLVPDIRKAYGRLAAENDIIVIEGAGSPAEINLKEDDIVNMGMARIAASPVLLVGDIDLGGVFAQLYGTAALLTEEERDRYLKGMIINKFRGDVTILEPGLRQIEGLTGKPVLGVVPYMHVDVDDEDSLADRLKSSGKKEPSLVDIAVIRLPRLSNFTDFNALGRISGVSVRYVNSVSAFGDPDLVILPGTKNTMGDLRWLRESGLEAVVKKAAAAGKPVIGICGGYQMLGETLSDPCGEESGQRKQGGRMRGIGLLPVDTVFSEIKTRTRVSGNIMSPAEGFEGLSGMKVEGYEIHMGASVIREGCGAVPLTRLAAEAAGERTFKDDGCSRGNVCGTYVHGIFDQGDMARRLASVLAEKKGVSLDLADTFDAAAYREQQYDILADTVRRSTDIGKIYAIIREGI